MNRYALLAVYFCSTWMLVSGLGRNAAAGTCEGVATYAGGSTYTLACVNPCTPSCHEVVREINPTTAAVSCTCITSEYPTICCRTEIVYQPDELPYPIANGRCSAPCGSGGVCTLPPGGDGDYFAECL